MYARAKINLALNILEKRKDNYHEIETIMHSLAFYDAINIKKVNKDDYGIKIVSNALWLPTDSRNLVYQAADYLINRFDIKTGIFIDIKKNIPSSAGLAGGSSDCAATLIGIRNLFELPIQNSELIKIGVKFGADVPFCIFRGCALAKGIGEKLNRIPSLPYVHIALITPPVLCSTKEIFSKFSKTKNSSDIEKLIFYINKKDIFGICKNLGNDLEDITIKKAPLILKIKNFLDKNGALKSLMTGSGPTVFAIFKDGKKARECIELFKKNKEFKNIKDIFLTRPFSL